MDTYSIVMAGSFHPGVVMLFKVHMKKVMDGEVNKDILEHITTKLTFLKKFNTGGHKDFAEKVKNLPFSLKEKYKILYCALYEERLKKRQNKNTANADLDAIKNWKEANGYGHLDCSHLYKDNETLDVKVIREIIYILHNTSLE
jgi:hypothetical protein